MSDRCVQFNRSLSFGKVTLAVCVLPYSTVVSCNFRLPTFFVWCYFGVLHIFMFDIS